MNDSYPSDLVTVDSRERFSTARCLGIACWRVTAVCVVVGIYAVLAPFGYAAFALLRRLPTDNPRGRARRLQGVMRRAFALMHDSLRWIGLLNFDPRRMAAKLPSEPSVLVANHLSWVDVTAICATVPNVTTAVKPSIFRRWWLKPLLTEADFFEGASGDALTIGGVVEAGIERLARGHHLLVFPEGTRCSPGEERAFGRTAFEIACRAEVPVVPIAIRMQPEWLTKRRGLFSPPVPTPRLELVFLPAEHPKDHGLASRPLRDVIQGRIHSELRPVVADRRWKKKSNP